MAFSCRATAPFGLSFNLYYTLVYRTKKFCRNLENLMIYIYHDPCGDMYNEMHSHKYQRPASIRRHYKPVYYDAPPLRISRPMIRFL